MCGTRYPIEAMTVLSNVLRSLFYGCLPELGGTRSLRALGVSDIWPVAADAGEPGAAESPHMMARPLTRERELPHLVNER